MRYAIGFLGLTLLAMGCSKAKNEPGQASTGRPDSDTTKTCIAAYLGQCGWKDVEFVKLEQRSDVPSEAKVLNGEAWAYTFTASYTNVLGERKTSENWVAILWRDGDRPCVRSCLDQERRLVGGHSGFEGNDVATLAPLPAGDVLPAIVAPQ